MKKKLKAHYDFFLHNAIKCSNDVNGGSFCPERCAGEMEAFKEVCRIIDRRKSVKPSEIIKALRRTMPQGFETEGAAINIDSARKKVCKCETLSCWGDGFKCVVIYDIIPRLAEKSEDLTWIGGRVLGDNI